MSSFFSTVSLNNFYYFIKNANAHNFADDNILATFAQTVWTLISVLESGSNIAIDWSEANKMIVNPGKFQSIIIDKKKQDHTKETVEIRDIVIEIEDKLNFSLLITKICRSAANQLNALISFEDKKALVYSQFIQISIIAHCYRCFLVQNL